MWFTSFYFYHYTTNELVLCHINVDRDSPDCQRLQVEACHVWSHQVVWCFLSAVSADKRKEKRIQGEVVLTVWHVIHWTLFGNVAVRNMDLTKKPRTFESKVLKCFWLQLHFVLMSVDVTDLVNRSVYKMSDKSEKSQRHRKCRV